MPVKIGLDIYPNRAMAWALDFPGCYSYGKDSQEAVVQMARALVSYEQWVQEHAGPGWFHVGDFDLRVVDAWEVYTINEEFDIAEDGYEVESFFLHDWKPLAREEIMRGMNLLRWSREDLMVVARELPDRTLDHQEPEERWPIRGILKHIANAEAWYLDRLELGGWGRTELPENVWQRLEVVRTRLMSVLPDLIEQKQVIGVDGEFWSPRKLLRRAIWHELDHREHIRGLLSKLKQQ